RDRDPDGTQRRRHGGRPPRRRHPRGDGRGAGPGRQAVRGKDYTMCLTMKRCVAVLLVAALAPFLSAGAAPAQSTGQQSRLAALRQLSTLQTVQQQTTALQSALKSGQLTASQLQALSQEQSSLMGLLTSPPPPLPSRTSRR